MFFQKGAVRFYEEHASATIAEHPVRVAEHSVGKQSLGYQNDEIASATNASQMQFIIAKFSSEAKQLDKLRYMQRG